MIPACKLTECLSFTSILLTETIGCLSSQYYAFAVTQERQSSAASQLQSSSQQQQDASVQPGSSTGHVATDGVAVAMQVLAKAEEKLHELQLHEARLKVCGSLY